MTFKEPTLSPRMPFVIDKIVQAIQEARRPIFIWGAGIRPYAEAARNLARSLGIPVACTWGAIDLMHYDDPLMAGGFGFSLSDLAAIGTFAWNLYKSCKSSVALGST